MDGRPYPGSVSEWTWDTLTTLSELEYSEDTYLEYKHHLQYPDNDNKKSRKEWRENVRREFTAFANTSGGIIVFGMTDNAKPAPFELPENEVDQLVSQLVQDTVPMVQTYVPSPIRNPDSDANRAVLPVQVLEANHKPVGTGEAAYYIRTNGRKQPMNRELIESWFVEGDRRQQAVRQLEMEIDRFTDVYNQYFHRASFNELPPYYSEIDTPALRETLRENAHLYAKEEMSDIIRGIFRELRDIESDERYYGRVLNGVLSSPHSDRGSFNKERQRELQMKVKRLKRRIDELTKRAKLSPSEPPIF